MRVLFLTHPRIGLNRGGLQIQIEATARGLADLGVDVVRYDPWSDQLPSADLCHVFSIDGAMAQHVERAASTGVPVVVSTVFSNFRHPVALTRLKVALSSSVPGMYSDLKRAARMLQRASRIIALHSLEKLLLCRAFSLPQTRVVIIPNGVAGRFGTADGEIFAQRYGVRDFVLHVGSFTRNKNQLALIRALRDKPHPLVLIGGSSPEDGDYLDLCRREAAGRPVIFAGTFEHDDPVLASAYAAAKLFVLPSFSEVMPLTLHEAAAAGCRLLVSDRVPVDSSLASRVRVGSPTDSQQLGESIDSAMRSDYVRDDENPSASLVSWHEVCGRIRGLYSDLVDQRVRGRAVS